MAGGRRFELQRQLGEGSFGTVYLADMVSLGGFRTTVALKVLAQRWSTESDAARRLRDEARLLGRLEHRNIVRVYDLVRVDGRWAVVMEAVRGADLEQVVHAASATGSPAPLRAALEVVRCIAGALHAALHGSHGQAGELRVVHRDIKPSNVILTPDGEVKVLDFGIARGEFEGREARTESVVMGSRPYMAPERLDGVSDSPSVDVYSAGMSLFELLTGRTMSLSINPVSHDQAMGRQLQHIEVQGMSAAATEDLRDLIRRMCAYTRDYRPSAADCARDLEQLIYAIDRRYHIHLEEFARSTVLPIYESRPRISPEDAIHQEDDDFLREVTGQITSPTSRTPAAAALPWAPYVFVGLLGFVVVLLGMLALGKALLGGGLGSGTSVAANDPPPGAPDTVRIEVWIPGEAQAQVGETFLRQKGAARVRPGPNLLEVMFDDGRTLHCPFQAADGTSVRWVGDDSVSIDDGDAIPCQTVRGG